MITSKSGGVVRVFQKFVTEAEYLASNTVPIIMVPGVPGKVLQAVNCTVECDPAQTIAYDKVPYVFTLNITVPQLIWLGFKLQGYSILSQSITGDIGNSLREGSPIQFGASEYDPTEGNGGMWVSLWYTIWPDKSGAF